MASIDTKTFKPYSEITVSEVERRSFDCDDLITPIISLLNQKGYKTQYCCAGHPYPHYEEMYIFLYEDTQEAISSVWGPLEPGNLFFLEAPVCKKVSLEEIAEGHQFDDCEIDVSRPFSVYYVEIDDGVFGSIAYISFKERYFDEEDLPFGWELVDSAYYDPEINEFVSKKIDSLMQFSFPYRQDYYYFFAQQVAVFMNTYDWVKQLPDISKSK